MKKQRQSGFTLIELMIVVAIIGVLAAFAIPTYNDYITRTQVAEAVELLSGLKISLNEYAADHGDWPIKIVNSSGTNNRGTSAAGENEIYGNLIGRYSRIDSTVSGINGEGYPKGQIKVTMTYGRASGKILTLTTVNAGAVWVCGRATVDGVTGSNTTIANKWLPNACK